MKIIEGEWERIDPPKPGFKSENEAQPVEGRLPAKVEPAATDPARPPEPEPAFTAAVEAYFEQVEKANARQTAAAGQQDDAFKEKLAGLKHHLEERGPKG